jgi:phosphatidylglycerol---prolipoprotein diacylglyceryl transferase
LLCARADLRAAPAGFEARRMPYPAQVHPVLFHIGSIFIPAYGAMAAAGVLLGLALAQRTARFVGVPAGQVWNLCVVAVCAALACQRLLLVAANWSMLRLHPAWMLGLAMIHHPLLAAAGSLAALACAAWYARSHRMPLLDTADALAPPLALGLAFEQLGALLAGSGYGVEAGPRLPWAVTYTSPFAALWSGTPLGIPLHPVQAYAALGFLTLSIFLFVVLPARRQRGEIAGIWLLGAGVVLYLTELWRDPEGRGLVLHGALDGPQIAAVLMVLAGGLVLRERVSGAVDRSTGMGGLSSFPQKAAERMGYPGADHDAELGGPEVERAKDKLAPKRESRGGA